MFARRKRLSRSVFSQKGKRLSSEHFSVRVPEHATGYAVVVPKKTAKLSVTRHRMKRKVTEALRTLPLPKALIVYPQKSVLFMKPKDIASELAQLVSKIR